jgi:hypothetical protein
MQLHLSFSTEPCFLQSIMLSIFFWPSLGVPNLSRETERDNFAGLKNNGDETEHSIVPEKFEFLHMRRMKLKLSWGTESQLARLSQHNGDKTEHSIDPETSRWSI